MIITSEGEVFITNKHIKAHCERCDNDVERVIKFLNIWICMDCLVMAALALSRAKDMKHEQAL